MKEVQFVDVVVVGSGFGGAVAAQRLGEAGYSTVVLERGRRWSVTQERNTFATYDKPDGRSAWLSRTTVDPLHNDVAIDVYTGILDRTIGEGISVLSGVGVGGGSLTFNGALVQPTLDAFRRVFPAQLEYEQFDALYYPRVRAKIRPAPVPEDLLSDPHFESSRLFLQWAQKADLLIHLLDMAMDWDLIRQEIDGRIEPHVITGQEMWYGLNSGARLSLDKNYLALAELTQHVEIRPLHVVTSIKAEKKRGEEYFEVSGQKINTDGELLEEFVLVCKTLFVAAGSIKTSELMVTAKTKGTLTQLNAHVGQGWGNNGDIIGMHRGHPAISTVSQVPGAVGAVHQNNPLGPVRLLGDALNDGSSGSLLSLCMVMPPTGTFPNKGFFRYDGQTRAVVLHWPKKELAIAQLMEAARTTYAFLDKASTQGCIHPVTPVLDSHVTAHPLGGMVLGKACRIDGRVDGYKGLYVIDGSLLPGTAGCANPSLTIAALAEYIMDEFFKHKAL